MSKDDPKPRDYFFCGIGGSGMLPLALIVKARGHAVEGSDRSLDQGRTAQKFEFLRSQGIALYAQDGSGVTRKDQILVASGAVEDTVPDVVAAKKVGAKMIFRPELLAELFNAATVRIGVAGTSGKSTTTGMIAWILHRAGRDPTVMNGAVMKNFVTPDSPFASALVGSPDVFVSEVDESDGSIARYTPEIAVINNIALDHKSMEELRVLFRDFADRGRVAVLNLDNAETAALAADRPKDKAITFSLDKPEANLRAGKIEPTRHGVRFEVLSPGTGEMAQIELKVPGRHNVANALAAIAAVTAVGVPLREAAEALESFEGIRRRLEVVGTARGVTVIDDFAHNPDKIAATLSTLHAFPGRVLAMFQPHGYGPLRTMREGFVEAFATGLNEDDLLVLPEPVYYGGTVERTIGSEDIARDIRARGRDARAFADRKACGDALLEAAGEGDTIVIMGARDDTLSSFATDLLVRIGSRPG
jgi:UDP-N-acetylmuramate--alanine ligase